MNLYWMETVFKIWYFTSIDADPILGSNTNDHVLKSGAPLIFCCAANIFLNILHNWVSIIKSKGDLFVTIKASVKCVARVEGRASAPRMRFDMILIILTLLGGHGHNRSSSAQWSWVQSLLFHYYFITINIANIINISKVKTYLCQVMNHRHLNLAYLYEL